jgi:hypothetical protein
MTDRSSKSRIKIKLQQILQGSFLSFRGQSRVQVPERHASASARSPIEPTLGPGLLMVHDKGRISVRLGKTGANEAEFLEGFGNSARGALGLQCTEARHSYSHPEGNGLIGESTGGWPRCPSAGGDSRDSAAKSPDKDKGKAFSAWNARIAPRSAHPPLAGDGSVCSWTSLGPNG